MSGATDGCSNARPSVFHLTHVHMQMFYDDLPIWGFIGKVEKIMSQSTKSWEKHELKYYLFTHIHFDILYNGDRVIEVNVSTDPSRTVEITEGENVIVDWTYSVKWRETSIPFEKRMDKYSRYSFLPQHLEVTALPTEYHCVLRAIPRRPSMECQKLSTADKSAC